MAVRAAVGERAGKVGGGEVGTGKVWLEVGGVAGGAGVVEEGGDCGRFTGCDEAGIASRAVSCREMRGGKRVTYSLVSRRFCTMRM